MEEEGTRGRWRNRIVGSGTVDPWNVKENPAQWRRHPDAQRKAMEGILSEVGWVQEVIVNKSTGNLVDGHLRVWIARKNGEREVPCKFVDLTEEEERLVLATLDPLGDLAGADKEGHEGLVESLTVQDEQLKAFLDGLRAADEGRKVDLGGPEGMELLPYEHYDYVMMMFKDRRDFIRAVQVLGLKKVVVQPESKHPGVGLCRVVDGQKIMERICGSSSRPEDGQATSPPTNFSPKAA